MQRPVLARLVEILRWFRPTTLEPDYPQGDFSAQPVAEPTPPPTTTPRPTRRTVPQGTLLQADNHGWYEPVGGQPHASNKPDKPRDPAGEQEAASLGDTYVHVIAGRHWKFFVKRARRHLRFAAIVLVINILIASLGGFNEWVAFLQLPVWAFLAYPIYGNWWYWKHFTVEVYETAVYINYPENKWFGFGGGRPDINVWQVQNNFPGDATIWEQWFFKSARTVTINAPGDEDTDHFVRMADIIDWQQLVDAVRHNQQLYIARHSARLS